MEYADIERVYNLVGGVTPGKEGNSKRKGGRKTKRRRKRRKRKTKRKKRRRLNQVKKQIGCKKY